jgi:hypothetical protein
VGREGIVRVLDYHLSAQEDDCLMASARFVAENVARAGY